MESQEPAVAAVGDRVARAVLCDRDAPDAAHTWAPGAQPIASVADGWGLCRASSTGRARLAAIATRQMRHTLGPPGAL